MIIVIADDLSLAAEMAGISHSHGLSTTLLTDLNHSLPVCDVIVIATDTRQMTEQQAVSETHGLCQQIKEALPKLTEARHAAMTPLQRAQAMAHPNEVLHIFKATDAELRGHVHQELRALVEESRYEQVMYLPANPSKGRTIRGGRYFVNGTPIDQTSHKHDPIFPIDTANVAGVIKVNPGSRLRICDAEDTQDIHRTVRLALNNHTPTLLAGNTDLLAALLEELGHKPSRHRQFAGLSDKGATLVLCSKSQVPDLIQFPYLSRHNIASAPLPSEVLEAVSSQSISAKEACDRWMGRLKQVQVVSGKTVSFLLTVPSAGSPSPEVAAALRQTTAEMAQRIVAQSPLSELVLEGGNLALATLRKLGWTRFQMQQQVAPGIVRMHCMDASHTHLTLKQSDCEWGELFN